MKYPFFILSILLILLSITGCGNTDKTSIDLSNLQQSAYDSSEQNKDVILSIKEETVTRSSDKITLVFNNNSEKTYLYEDMTLLEKEIDGTWYSINHKPNVAWKKAAFILKPKEAREIDFLIESYYGLLDTGKYRVIKLISEDSGQQDSFITTEFNID